MLIQCKIGHTSQTVRGTAYSFDRDRYGRYVAQVHDERDAECFLAVEHYVVVTDIPEPEKSAFAPPAPVIPEEDEPIVMAEYKGFKGSAELAKGDGGEPDVFHGRLLGIRDIITFEADKAEELQGQFEAAVDEYIEALEELEKMGEQSLVGSGVLPSTFDIGGETVQLGTIVSAAHVAFGGTADEWNALADDVREGLLRAELERRYAAVPPEPQVGGQATGIVAPLDPPGSIEHLDIEALQRLADAGDTEAARLVAVRTAQPTTPAPEEVAPEPKKPAKPSPAKKHANNRKRAKDKVAG